jgi:hypothetical protein
VPVDAIGDVIPSGSAPMKSWRRVTSTNRSVCSATRMMRISRFPHSSAPVDCGVRRFSITSGQDRRERISRDRQLLDVGGVAGGVTDAIFLVTGTACLLKGQRNMVRLRGTRLANVGSFDCIQPAFQSYMLWVSRVSRVRGGGGSTKPLFTRFRRTNLRILSEECDRLMFLVV